MKTNRDLLRTRFSDRYEVTKIKLQADILCEYVCRPSTDSSLRSES